MGWLYKMKQIWTSGNVWILIFLGFASGLPFSLTSTTLQAWLTTAGVKLIDIGLFSLVGIPYLYKFVWSPLMDRYVPPLLGRRRGWMIISQIALIVAIVAMAIVGVKSSLYLLGCLALLTAFFSASQDIAIDAYRTDLLTSDERGLGSAVFIGGWRIGALLSGGLALILANYLGWRMVYFVMAGFMLVGLLASLMGPQPSYEKSAPTTLYQAVVMPFKEFLTRPYGVALLVFIFLYKISDAFAFSLMSTFLLRHMGFDLVTVGTVFKIFGVFAILFGTILGGVLIPYLKLFKSLLLFGFLQCVSNLMFLWLALVGKHYALLVSAVVLDNIAGGMSTAVFVAFLMSLCNHHYTATQFALLSALSAVGRVVLGPLAAVFVLHFGWPSFFVWSFILGLPALVLLLFLRPAIEVAEAA